MGSAKPGPLVRSLIVLVGVLLGMGVFLAAKVNNPPPLDPSGLEFKELLGRQVPEAEFALLGEQRTVSTREYAGQAHLLLFSNSGCPVCDELYPVVKEIAAKIPVLVIATGNREEMLAKIEKNAFGFPVAFDSLLNSAGLVNVWHYPTAMFIDRSGAVVKAASGYYAESVVRLALASAGGK